MSSDFATILRQFRTEAGLSQEQLARELKVSYATVNRWETGKTVPEDAVLHLLADFVRKHGSGRAELADQFERGGFNVPEKSRRGRRARPAEEENGALDTKAMETMLWKAACSIRGEKDAPKFKDYILPLLFVKRLSDVFEDEFATLAGTLGGEAIAREVLEKEHIQRGGGGDLVRFYIPEHATWPVISGRKPFAWPEEKKPKTVGEMLTTAVRSIARENESLRGVIDLIDFNAAPHGEREISDEALGGVIELFSRPRYRLGINDVEPDFLGRAYEYLLRKFAEGQGQSAGEFFTPKEVGFLMAYLVRPKQGEEVYDPTCGSAGLLVKCELALIKAEGGKEKVKKPLKLYGQELTGSSYAIARMNMVLHDMEGEVVRGNTMTNPKFLDGSSLKKFDIVVANPMWNQNNFSAKEVYEADKYERFDGGIPPESSADWGWLQHMLASLDENGRAAIVLDTGAVSRGSGNQGENREKTIRRWFIENNFVDCVILLPENLFYNTPAAGIIIVLRKGRRADELIVLLNASGEFEKGRPKNYLTADGVRKIADAFHSREAVDRFMRVVTREEVEAKDFNLSPSGYVQIGEMAASRDIQHISDELSHLIRRQRQVDQALAQVMGSIGIHLDPSEKESNP